MTAMTAHGRRLEAHTEPEVRAALDRELLSSLDYHARHPEHIPLRLEHLRQEWDLERAVQTTASLLTLGSVLASLLSRKSYLLIAGAVSVCMLQYTFTGKCPPLPLLRRSGIRSKDEILQEYFGLCLLHRGFDELESLRQASSQQKADAVLRVLQQDLGVTAMPAAGVP